MDKWRVIYLLFLLSPLVTKDCALKSKQEKYKRHAHEIAEAEGKRRHNKNCLCYVWNG